MEKQLSLQGIEEKKKEKQVKTLRITFAKKEFREMSHAISLQKYINGRLHRERIYSIDNPNNLFITLYHLVGGRNIVRKDKYYPAFGCRILSSIFYLENKEEA